MERNNLRQWCQIFAIALLVAGCGLSCQIDKSQKRVPVVFEESHGGSYYVFSKLSPPGTEACLINFDTHSDAVGLSGMDEFNLQCYNWIEPLMPKPVSKLIWVIPYDLTPEREEACLNEVKEKLGRGLFFERASMEAVSICDFENLSKQISSLPSATPLFITLDLDYWDRQRYWEKDLAGVLAWVADQKNIKGVTVCSSLLYHNDQEAAYAMLEKVFRFFLDDDISEENKRWDVFFEPYRTWPEDLSIRGIEFRREGKEIPVLNPENAPSSLKKLWYKKRREIKVTIEPEKWRKFLKRNRY